MVEDWVDVLLDDNVTYLNADTHLSHRFEGLNIEDVDVDNYQQMLVLSLAEQVEMFIPPSGSFETADLRRYLELIRVHETSTHDLVFGLTLADQLRIAFSDGETKTICERFPDVSLQEKRRYRCVCEYLIRSGQLEKVKDDQGRLVKKLGNMGKLVVLYRPLPLLYKSLTKSGLGQFIKVKPKEEV